MPQLPGQTPPICGFCEAPIAGILPMPTPLPGDLASFMFPCMECGAVLSITIVPRSWLPEDMKQALAKMEELSQAARSALAEPTAEEIANLNPNLRRALQMAKSRKTS